MPSTRKRQAVQSPPKPSQIASRANRKHPDAERRLHSQGIQTIESVLGTGHAPVLGAYLHTVHILLIKSLSRDARFRSIMPHLIGTPALLSRHPGMSQIELAALLGTERMTAGLQVSQCIAKGFVRRSISRDDARKYELYVTTKGLRLLAAARKVIPEHEDLFASVLTRKEREELRRLLLKLITR